jgi:hypothetical protein
MVVMGYDACHRAYQRLWFHLLDEGYRVPGFAECDIAFDRDDLLDDALVLANRLRLDRPVDAAAITAAARAGACCASSGPLALIEVDGVAMGGRCRSAAEHRVRITALPAPGERRLRLVELVGPGGAELVRRDDFAGGIIELACAGGRTPGWLLVRAYGEHEDPDAVSQKAIRRFALSNPVYLGEAGARPAAETVLDLRAQPGSPWAQAAIGIESADGVPLDDAGALDGDRRIAMPAGARLRLVRDGRQLLLYPAMENADVQRRLRFLHEGHFLRRWPGLRPGELPPEAFDLEGMRTALERCQIVV